MSAKKISDADFIQAYNDGMSYRKMTKHFNVAQSTIQCARRRLKLPKRGAPVKKPKKEPKDSDENMLLMIAKCPFCYSDSIKLTKIKLKSKLRNCYKCKTCLRDFMTPEVTYHSTKTKTKVNIGIKAKLAFDKDAFIKDAKDGMSKNKLSQKYRMAYSTVAKRMREFGLLLEAEKKSKKKTMESIIPVKEPLTVEKIAKNRCSIPPSPQELKKRELDAKINAIRQISRMSKKEMDSYLEDEVLL
jgi:transposase